MKTFTLILILFLSSFNYKSLEKTGNIKDVAFEKIAICTDSTIVVIDTKENKTIEVIKIH